MAFTASFLTGSAIGDETGQGAVHGHKHYACALVAVSIRRCRERGRIDTLSCQERGVANEHDTSINCSPDAEASDRFEIANR